MPAVTTTTRRSGPPGAGGVTPPLAVIVAPISTSEEPVGVPQPLPPRRSLAGRFRLLWLAGGVSSIGDGLAAVALPLLAATLTRDPRLIAGVVIAQRLPWLVLGLPAGGLADRWDRRRLLAVSEFSRMAILLALGAVVAAHGATMVVIYAAAFLLGSFETLFSGATFAALPALVEADDLAKANGRLGATEAAGEFFIGPAIGGLLFAAAAGLPFVFDGVSFAASAALLLLAFPRGLRVQPTPSPADPSASSIAADVRAGLAYLVRHPILRLLAVLLGALAFCQGLCMSILVLYGLQVLRLGPAGYGLFLTVTAVGDIAGSLMGARLHARYGTALVLMAAGLIGALTYLMLGLTSSVPVAGFAVAVEALSVGVGLVASLALRQTIIPAGMLGRVGNTFRTVALTLMPAGALIGGIIAHSAGLHASFLVAAFAQTLVMITVGIRLSRRLKGLVDPSASEQ
jgi:MFS family permease